MTGVILAAGAIAAGAVMYLRTGDVRGKATLDINQNTNIQNTMMELQVQLADSTVCTTALGGVVSADGNNCTSINIPGTIYGLNLQADGVILAGNRRTTFDHNTCNVAGNSYIGSISPSGAVTCKTVNFRGVNGKVVSGRGNARCGSDHQGSFANETTERLGIGVVIIKVI